MTEKKLEANRRNALKSTGPKTPAGKAVSSRNAVKHGLLSVRPIPPGLKSLRELEKRRDRIFKRFVPVGVFEVLLANELAITSWRLWYAVRYEVGVAAAAVAAVEQDLEDRAEPGCGKPPGPAEARAKATMASSLAGILENLPVLREGRRMHKVIAVAILQAIWAELPEEFREISIPGIPDDDAEFDAFDDWTAGLVRQAAEAYAAAAQMTREAVLNKCITSAYKSRDQAKAEERDLVERGQRWQLLLERECRSRMLREPDRLGALVRYKTNLQRWNVRVLREIERLQAARSGAVVPPPATMDVDPNVHTEGS